MENNLITTTYRKKVGSTQNIVEATIRPTDEDNISKVIGLSAKACLKNIEITNSEANYTLDVFFDLTFCDENANILCATETVQVGGKMESNLLNADMDAIYKVEVVDTTILSATNTDVKVQATVELVLDALCYNNIDCFESTNEKLMVKREPAKVCSKVASGQAKFDIEGEFELKNNFSKILNKNVSVCIKNVTSGTEYITIEGDMRIWTYLLYEENDEKIIKPLVETIAFKEEIDAEGVSKDNVIEANFCVDYANINFEIETSENNSVLKVAVPVLVRYVALNVQDVELACDAYSTTHKVNLVNDSYLINQEQKSTIKQHIEGELEIDENLPRIAKIVMLTDCNINLTKVASGSGMANIEGILTVPVVYLGDDETESFNGVQVEVPFAINVDVDGLNEDDEIFVRTNIQDIIAKAKKGKDIEIDAEVAFEIESYSSQAHSFVKDVVLTEELTANPYPLAIYLAPAGATLWDIAKQLAVDENTILTQNPNLIFPLEKTESIVYFKKD